MKHVFLALSLFAVFSISGCIQQSNDAETQPRPPAPIVTSFLEIYDLTTGTRTVIRDFPNTRIEAPNWTPDGKWLIYNSGGL